MADDGRRGWPEGRVMAPEGGLTAAWRVARGRKRPPVGAAGHVEGIESHVERPADADAGLAGRTGTG